MPAAISQLGLAAVGGKLYAVGGYIAGDTGSLEYPVQVYDPVENTWMLKAPIPTPRSSLGAASVNGKIYAIGGFKPGLPEGEGFADEVEEYDPQTNTWRNRTPMPTKRYSVGVAELNGKIYVAGGHSLNEYLAKLEMYDPATDIWIILPPMMTPRSEFALVASNGKLYAIGGHYYGSQGQPDQWLNTVESYDPISGIWSTKASLPIGLGMHGAVALDNGHIHVFGGRNTAILNTVMKYDPEANSWSTAGTMPNSRYNFGIAKAAGANIYLVGGNTTFNSNYPVNLTERATVVYPWTIMFYLANDNDLDDFTTIIMQGLRQQAAGNPNVHVVVFLDRPTLAQGAYYWLAGDPKAPFIEGENKWYKGIIDTGDPKNLVDFVTAARSVFPALHYALVLSNHGTGLNGAMQDLTSPKDTDGQPSRLTLKEIRQAMDPVTENGAKKIDVLYMEACFMGMLETAYQVRGFIDYYVASVRGAVSSDLGTPITFPQ